MNNYNKQYRYRGYLAPYNNYCPCLKQELLKIFYITHNYYN